MTFTNDPSQVSKRSGLSFRSNLSLFIICHMSQAYLCDTVTDVSRPDTKSNKSRFSQEKIPETKYGLKQSQIALFENMKISETNDFHK